jgi:hypothetical protein
MAAGPVLLPMLVYHTVEYVLCRPISIKHLLQSAINQEEMQFYAERDLFFTCNGWKT